MLLVWHHTDQNPERVPRQQHPILLQTDDPLAILRALGDNVEWRGRVLYLHPDSTDPQPESALAMVGWGKIDGQWQWVADGPGTHGFLRDSMFEWVQRGMVWTKEQRDRAWNELVSRGWISSANKSVVKPCHT